MVVEGMPTEREKSRMYAIGSPSSPLLEMMMTDHGPVQSWFFSRGQVAIWYTSSGVNAVSLHRYSSPLGSTRMLLAKSFLHPSNVETNVKGSEDEMF